MKAFDPLGALASLVEHEVDYVLIGGLAARLHGSPTVTDDLDISHSKDRANLRRLAACLEAMNATLRLPDPEERVDLTLDWRVLHAGDNFTFATDFGAVGCLAAPPGVRSYAALRDAAVTMDLELVTIRVASIDDLMAMKQASAGPKDLVELEILAALKEEIARDR